MGRDCLKAVATAFAAVAIAFGSLEFVLPENGGTGTYVTASTAIVVAAVTAGLFAGLLAVVMSGMVVVYLHLPPIGVLHVDRVEELTGLALFVGGGLVVSTVGSIARQGLSTHAQSRSAATRAIVEPAESAPSSLLGVRPLSRLRPAPVETLVEPLTTREVEVLEALAAGMSNEDIATSLYISVNTVKTHLKNVYGKLQVASRTQAVARAAELGVIGVPVGPPAQSNGQLAA